MESYRHIYNHMETLGGNVFAASWMECGQHVHLPQQRIQSKGEEKWNSKGKLLVLFS